MANSSVRVRGEATLEVEPEIAVISVTVMASDPDRHRVLESLAKRNGRVLALIRAQGTAVEKAESGPANVYPEVKGKARERVGGYVARASVSVTVGDFTILGDLMMALAEEAMVAVAGPWWQLRPDSPVRRQVRVAAARDALQRAREYAEAFGGTVTDLVEVADIGLLTEGAPMPVRAMAAGAPAPPGAAPVESLDLRPAKQTVRAQVEARFTMTAPTLGG